MAYSWQSKNNIAFCSCYYSSSCHFRTMCCSLVYCPGGFRISLVLLLNVKQSCICPVMMAACDSACLPAAAPRTAALHFIWFSLISTEQRTINLHHYGCASKVNIIHTNALRYILTFLHIYCIVTGKATQRMQELSLRRYLKVFQLMYSSSVSLFERYILH